MTAVPRSSGDLIADRRFLYAEGLLADGDAQAAAEVFAQALERAPCWPDGHAALARARRAAGDGQGAVAAWRRVLALEPDDALGARLELALLGDVSAPAVPPAAYVTALFDQYAAGFEAALVGRLGYAAPAMLAGLVAASGRRFAHGIDLGCGTGLMGEAVQPLVDRLDGVDLSPAMLAQAATKGIFSDLAAGDVVDVLRARPGRYDLALAADVLCYLGDLSPVFMAVAESLVADGLFAFTVEALDEDGETPWRLRPSLRYAHAATHVRAASLAAGFEVGAVERLTLRLDGGEPVAGFAVMLRRGR